MRRAWLALALATIILAPGCLDSNTYEGLWDDLEAEDEYHEQSFLIETINFSVAGLADPMNPPGSEEDASDSWNETITLPNGTQSMTVLFQVNFSASDLPDSPLPTNPPDGDISIYAQSPEGEQGQNTTLQENANLGFEFTNPNPGDWTIGFDARGEGTITFRVLATVPINGTSA